MAEFAYANFAAVEQSLCGGGGRFNIQRSTKERDAHLGGGAAMLGDAPRCQAADLLALSALSA